MNTQSEQRRVRVDMHCHTRLSGDSLNDPRRLAEIASQRGIDVLCVTDHNGLANATALSKMADLPVRVIPSEEVKTSEGEIIGYFLSELVPKGLSPEETVQRIKAQGGLVGVPHPFDSLRTASRLQTTALIRLVDAGMVDMIEVFNSRAARTLDNDRARQFAAEHGLAMSAGSDAHTLVEVGRAYVEIPDFGTPEEFLECLRAGAVHGVLSNSLIHLGSTWAKVVKVVTGQA